MRSTTGSFVAALLAGVMFAAAPALAQSTVQCSETGTDEERIACLQARVDALEAELARARGELEAATPAEAPVPAVVEEPGASFGAEQLDAPPVVEAPAAVSPATAATAAVVEAPAAATAAAEPTAREGRRWLRMPSVPFFGRGDDEEEPAAEPAPTQVAVMQSEPAAAPTSDDAFGAEQVAARTNTRDAAREQEEVLRAQIIDFQELHRGRLVVALDNGQMWRQMDVDTRRVRLREGETYPVEIRRSGFGGYRMKIADNNRIFQVERLR